MLNQLENYYRTQGILATCFTCRHQAECSGTNEAFTGPKSASVSKGYERHRPRLLFLSLDSGSAEGNPEKRLPHAVRRGMENVDVGRLRRTEPTKHWYRTHELAWYILKHFHENLEEEDVKYYFAHTNAAKCCQNKPKGLQADAILFRNCRGYLAGEIRVLRPDIVVTQGDWAKWGLKPIVDVLEQIDEYARIARFDGRQLFWLHTWHPRRFGDFYKQRGFDTETGRCEGWQKYAEHTREFIDRTRRDRR